MTGTPPNGSVKCRFQMEICASECPEVARLHALFCMPRHAFGTYSQ